jgi:predicted MFS family arabinose efflux permease
VPETSTRGWADLFAGYSGRILLALSLGWFGVVTARLLLPPLLPAIIADLEITLASAGFMLTVMQAVQALALYPSGRLSDQLSRATTILPGLAILTVGLLLIALAPVYVVLLGAVTVLGAGAGLFTISSRALISDHFVENRGRALGIYAAGFNVGGILASALAAVTFERWRLPFLAIAVLLAGITAVYVSLNHEPVFPQAETVEIELGSTLRRILSTPALRGPLVAYSLYYFVTRSFLGFFPAYLQSSKGFSPALASGAFALVFAVGAVTKVLAGDLSDRVPRRFVAVGSAVLAMGALAGIIFEQSVLVLAPLIVLFAAGHQAQFPLIDAILLDAAPTANVGGDLGAAKTIFFLIGSLGPTYVGVVAERSDYTVAFAGLVVCLLVSATLLFRNSQHA